MSGRYVYCVVYMVAVLNIVSSHFTREGWGDHREAREAKGLNHTHGRTVFSPLSVPLSDEKLRMMAVIGWW
jgi:hypothetical protein